MTQFSVKEKYRYQGGFDSYLEWATPIPPPLCVAISR